MTDNICSCDHPNCACKGKNDEFLKIEQKIKELEKLIEKVYNIEKYNKENNNQLQQSIIFEKLDDGNVYQKIKSNLGENYLVIENTTKIRELNRSEYNIIKTQDDLVRYTKTKEYIKKIGNFYKWISTIIYLGKIIV